MTADLDFDTDTDGDIDSGDDYWNAGAGWVPVGDAFNPFTATFDGDGHTVSNLFIEFVDSSNFYPAGLFGMIQDGVVRGVGLLDADVTGGSYVGALVGFVSDGEVSDSSVTGSVSGDDYVGGLVGRSGVFFYDDESHSAITGSYSTAQVLGRDNVGGLVGLSTSTGGITASFATGHVEGTEKIGGLVGFSIGTITTSYATGHVKGARGCRRTGWGRQGQHHGQLRDRASRRDRERRGPGRLRRRHDHGQLRDGSRGGGRECRGLGRERTPNLDTNGELLGHAHLRTGDWDRRPHHNGAASAHGLRRHLSDLEPGPGRRRRGRRSLGFRHERPVPGAGRGL